MGASDHRPEKGSAIRAPQHQSSAAPELPPSIGPREGLILTAVVESYIASGSPVGSQSIARQQNREGLSAATVRNVMAELADSGYLEQPHTSAGRVPTARAFRYYVEQLLQTASAPGRGLPEPAQERIEESLTGVASATDFFARTSHILALLSGGVGVGVTAIAARERLQHVHFARLGAARVLTVLVTAGGVVRDRVLTLDRDRTPAELEQAARYLNANFHGWELERIRQELTRRMELERSEYNRILASLEELWAKGAMSAAEEGAESARAQDRCVFVEGVANLVVEEVDRGRLRGIFMALEEKQRVIDLLNAYVDSRDPAAVRVVVGLEDRMPEMQDLVLIAAPARRNGEHLGALAVIGPRRMQYASTIGSVTYIADLFARWAETAG